MPCGSRKQLGRTNEAPVPNWAHVTGSPTPLRPNLPPPRAGPPPYIAVTVHTQRLDLGGLLLLVLGADRPEQVLGGWSPGRGGRGGSSSRRGPRLHIPAHRHDPHAHSEPPLPASVPLVAPPLPPALPPAAFPPFLKEAADSGPSGMADKVSALLGFYGLDFQSQPDSGFASTSIQALLPPGRPLSPRALFRWLATAPSYRVLTIGP